MESPLKAFLERYKNLIPTDRVIKETVVEVLEEVCDVSIETNQVTVRRGVVFLRVSPHVRALVYRKKDQLMQEVSSRSGKDITDVR